MRKNINISPVIFLGALCIICLALAVHCARAGEPTPSFIDTSKPVFITMRHEAASYISAGITRGNVSIHYEGKKFIEITGLHTEPAPLGPNTNAWPKYQPPEKPEEITVELITKDGTTYTAQWVKKEPK